MKQLKKQKKTIKPIKLNKNKIPKASLIKGRFNTYIALNADEVDNLGE